MGACLSSSAANGCDENQFAKLGQAPGESSAGNHRPGKGKAGLPCSNPDAQASSSNAKKVEAALQASGAERGACSGHGAGMGEAALPPCTMRLSMHMASGRAPGSPCAGLHSYSYRAPPTHAHTTCCVHWDTHAECRQLNQIVCCSGPSCGC